MTCVHDHSGCIMGLVYLAACALCVCECCLEIISAYCVSVVCGLGLMLLEEVLAVDVVSGVVAGLWVGQLCCPKLPS